VLPEGVEVVNTNMAPLAISPDGRSIAFPGRKAGRTQLYVYDISTGRRARSTVPTMRAVRSSSRTADGLASLAGESCERSRLAAPSPDELADAADGRGATWSTDDIIYYAPNNATGLWRVPASGGAGASQLTKPDPAASEISHRNPYALPDGKGLLFMVWTGPGADEHRIEYLSIADSARHVVARNAEGPLDIVGGRLIYAGRQDTVLSVPWNGPQPGAQSAEPVALPFLAQMDNEGAAAFAVSDNGTIVRLMGHTNRRLARVVWVDRTGRIDPLGVPERDYVSATISPDGTRAAIHNRGGTEEIWIYDFRSKSFTPLTTPGGSSQAPVWTTDSRYIVYRGTRQGFRNIFRKAADGTGAEERLTTKGGVIQTPTSATPDGKWIVFLESGAAGAGDLLKVALEGAHEIQPLVETPAQEIAGQASPDGRWVAVESTASGRAEIWVQPLGPDGRAKGALVPISRDGGNAPRWSRDGREIFFMTPDAIMGVAATGNSFSQPRAIVSGRFRGVRECNSNYDVAKDGRFLHVLPIEVTRPQTRIEVVLNGVSK
jgi:Tol biopolymer transport system component